jgi:flavorubredoxin
MKITELYKDTDHRWLVFGRDPDKPEKIIDTNQYLIQSGDRCLLMDPGGIELFAPMLAAVVKEVPLDAITDLFASHQDPDIISSLGLWDQSLQKGTLHAPWLWESFIRHFGMSTIEYNSIPDEGGNLRLGNTTLEFIPAHYLHSSGNFHVYDPSAKVLMSGDVGAALEGLEAPMFVEDFNEHVQYMEMFHRRWMPSNKAKNDWINRVRKLDIEFMAPQHGRIFKGDDVKRFLDWFEALEVGSAIK